MHAEERLLVWNSLISDLGPCNPGCAWSLTTASARACPDLLSSSVDETVKDDGHEKHTEQPPGVSSGQRGKVDTVLAQAMGPAASQQPSRPQHTDHQRSAQGQDGRTSPRPADMLHTVTGRVGSGSTFCRPTSDKLLEREWSVLWTVSAAQWAGRLVKEGAGKCVTQGPTDLRALTTTATGR